MDSDSNICKHCGGRIIKHGSGFGSYWYHYNNGWPDCLGAPRRDGGIREERATPFEDDLLSEVLYACNLPKL